MRQRGFTQNEEYIGLALRQGREFIIPCKDEAQANSKRVSLYNVKRTLSREDQKLLVISKEHFGDKWAIKISKCFPEVWEIIDGKAVRLEETSADLSEVNVAMIKDMIQSGCTREEMIANVITRGELEERVIPAVDKLLKEMEEVRNA